MGECYQLLNHPNKVIKLSILFETPTITLQDAYFPISQTLSYLMATQPSTYALIFEYQMLNLCNKGHLIYYYVMEKLIPLTTDEEKSLSFHHFSRR